MAFYTKTLISFGFGPSIAEWFKSEKLYPEKDFNWQNTKVKALGVWLSTDPEITTKLNFSEKIEKNEEMLGLLDSS